MQDILIYAIPFFVALGALEFVYGLCAGNNTYRLNDTISSLSQGLLSQAVAACTPLFQIGLYVIVYRHAPNWGDRTFWTTWYGVVLAVVMYDFLDYWLHRVGHESNLFWAAHVVHHQSQRFNFSTALRQESAYPIVGCIFFFPLALLGVPPQTYATAGAAVLLYQFWVHTEHIGKLGWFDRIFTSPSNHRVHHSINARYIDKNYGSILIIWDRLFGTYEPENEPCIYGTLVPLNSWNPLQALFAVFADMGRKLACAAFWSERLKVVFKYPGWVPAAWPVGGHHAQPAGSPPVYDPPYSARRGMVSIVFFLLAAFMATILLWDEDQWGMVSRLLAALLIASALWVAGKMLTQPQPVSR